MIPGFGTTFDEAAARIAAARTFAELLGGEGADGVGIERQAYRHLAKIVHPDAAGLDRKGPANEAFIRLNQLYHTREDHPAGKPQTRWKGDLADLYEDDGLLVKVVRNRANNDLMAAEATALRRLRTHGSPDYRAYAPALKDTFSYHGRTANVLTLRRGFRSLAETADLEPGDLVWIWRRLLAGLGWAHRAGVVHGAVFEEHVLIEPRVRGLVLVDWCYSTAVGARPKALITNHESQYPPEVPAGRPVTAATDIHLATSLMKRLFGADMPLPLRRFADGCLYDAPRMRPQNAWQLLTELDDLIPPRYRN